ncbi:hypothetical protein FA95DRAFT_1312981 [Auriscalpium vulgare]|uniref:Uncharacterized protein n=1 Tax=Auriscalpium vulgare TaxID=40419 RepID=A0ACB8RTD9_9AGAM|nr:hypothetical protein FA95DRAFT_1312981 [Auriscalpium vulgare]
MSSRFFAFFSLSTASSSHPPSLLTLNGLLPPVLLPRRARRGGSQRDPRRGRDRRLRRLRRLRRCLSAPRPHAVPDGGFLEAHHTAHHFAPIHHTTSRLDHDYRIVSIRGILNAAHRSFPHLQATSTLPHFRFHLYSFWKGISKQ